MRVKVTDMSICEGDEVELKDRLQGVKLRVWADEGSMVAVLAYNKEGRTDGVPIYMEKVGLQPIDEPTDRDETFWGDFDRQYYRSDEVRLITPFESWIMMVEKKKTIFPTYVLVRFGEETEIGFVGRSMAWLVHVNHLKHTKPKVHYE